MKKFLMSVMAVALCAGIAVASEDAAAGKTCPMGAKKGAKCICKGTVESVDAVAGKVSIKDEAGKVMTCTVDAKTKIKIGKKKATLAEVVVGEPVEAVCKGEVIKSLTVKVAKKNAMKKEAKKAEEAK